MRDTTVQDVAARARMAAGSISQYFGSKELLLTATLRFLSEQFEASWQTALREAGREPARRLRSFVACYFEPSICERPKLAVWFAFWGEAKARPHYREVCSGHDRRHDEALSLLCQALIADGRYALEPTGAATIISSQCHGLWLEMLTGTQGLDRRALSRLALATLSALFPRHALEFNP